MWIFTAMTNCNLQCQKKVNFSSDSSSLLLGWHPPLYVTVPIYLPIHPSICPSICPFVPSSIHSSICPFVHLSVCPSVHPSIHPSIQPSVSLSVPLSPYLRNSTSSDHNFWCTCVTWWYLQVFFLFLILIFWAVRV